jgi:hypothetical protein
MYIRVEKEMKETRHNADASRYYSRSRRENSSNPASQPAGRNTDIDGRRTRNDQSEEMQWDDTAARTLKVFVKAEVSRDLDIGLCGRVSLALVGLLALVGALHDARLLVVTDTLLEEVGLARQ